MQEKIYRLAKVTQVNDDGRVKVTFTDDPVQHDVWLSCNTTMYGETNEGLHSKMAIDDWVIVSFLDYPESTQKPFVLGKIKTTGDSLNVTNDTKIKYNDIIVKFENNKVTFENLNAPFQDITFGGLKLFEFLAGIQTVGNLGLPCPLFPSQITQIVNAIAASKKIVIGVN